MLTINSHITLLYLILRLIGSWGGERLPAGQIRIVRGRVAQDEHRLLPLQLGQLVQDVQQLLQVVLEGLQRGLLTPRPHGAICKYMVFKICLENRNRVIRKNSM
jgi:hypothetical protein